MKQENEIWQNYLGLVAQEWFRFVKYIITRENVCCVIYFARNPSALLIKSQQSK